MRTYLAIIAYALVSIAAFSTICRDSIANAEGAAILSKDKTIAESPTKVILLKKPSSQSIDTATIAKSIEPRISFEKTIFDLGNVGQGTKNTCEFRFTNTGRGLLKIGKISRTCGWRR